MMAQSGARVALTVILSSVANVTSVTAASPPRLTAVPFTAVHFTDTFWAPRLETNRLRTIPYDFKMCEDTGRISNFAKSARLIPGTFEGIYYNDSDVYKVVEGAAYSLAVHPDPDLDAYLDRLIATFAAAQQPDGYLNTYYTLAEPGKRWTDLRVRHELYCAGHLIEAAVAHYRATGKRNLLGVAIRYADHIDSVFGPGKRHGVCGHEEIELALVKLSDVTGEPRYLNLAKWFLDERGVVHPDRPLYGDYAQDHKPIREQDEIVGHAVRATYLYSAVADVAALSGDQGFIDTMDRIWRDVTQRKMYITGGIGPSARNEGFTVPYDLPNDSAYAETCAAIGMALWNHRLALLHADAKYFDVVERVIYNGILSGVSLDGERFFYDNPLASRGHHHRQPWFDCSCCPTNVVRFLPSLPGFVYAVGGDVDPDNKHNPPDSLYVNMYVASEATVTIAGTRVRLVQETNYPWDGQVRIRIDPETPIAFTLLVRVPSWCAGPQSDDDLYRVPDPPTSLMMRLECNGEGHITYPDVVRGYRSLARTWKPGDVVDLDFTMPVRRVYANPKVQADMNRVALQRGPIVYCIEAADSADGHVRHLALPDEALLSSEFRPDLLNGVTVITGAATSVSRGPDNTRIEKQDVPFTAIPYYAWDHRAPGEMVVWIPTTTDLAEPAPPPTLASRSRVSASHVYAGDAAEALNDQVEPASSGDDSIPRHTFWDHLGTDEWIQYDFPAPATVSQVEVYWFDDTGHGQCRVPQSWRLLYRTGDDSLWQPVTSDNPSLTPAGSSATSLGVEPNQFNKATFVPVTASAVRIELKLREKFSAGVLEWRVK